MKRLVEVRSYKLTPGTTAAFHDAFVTRAVPLLREWGTDVVAFGPLLSWPLPSSINSASSGEAACHANISVK